MSVSRETPGRRSAELAPFAAGCIPCERFVPQHYYPASDRRRPTLFASRRAFTSSPLAAFQTVMPVVAHCPAVCEFVEVADDCMFNKLVATR